MTGRLEGKAAVVTGAGAGIGAATARRFAAEGARLALNDLRAERLDQLVAELAAGGAEVVGSAGDASERATVDALIALAIERFGRVDVLYANAAYSIPHLVADITDEEWREQQRVVLDSVFYATRAVLPHMVRQGGGSIIAISSGAGIGGEYSMGAYAAHKAAVINLMETVAMEYGPYGVRANAITPGPTATEPMLAWVATQPGGEAAHASALDLKRLSRPEEVANLVLFLASDESSNITGTCIRSNVRAKHRPGD